MNIGFVGLGVMGNAMAKRLIEAGYHLRVHNRTRSKAEEVLGLGARWCDTPAEVAVDSEVVITIVGTPRDVEEVYLSQEGIISASPSGALLIDMTTSSPALAQKIAESANQRGLGALDAPVSGGDLGAREGTLSIMVGGDADSFERAKPIFDRLGKNIVLQGPPGSGQHTKMCNQIAIAGTMLGMSEALA